MVIKRAGVGIMGGLRVSNSKRRAREICLVTRDGVCGIIGFDMDRGVHINVQKCDNTPISLADTPHPLTLHPFLFGHPEAANL